MVTKQQHTLRTSKGGLALSLAMVSMVRVSVQVDMVTSVSCSERKDRLDLIKRREQV